MYTTRIGQLSPDLLTLWLELLDSCRSPVGPLLHPDYVRAVDVVRDDVEVGVLEEDGEVKGFLPFQRGKLGIARPVGGRLCDQSGAILRAGATWNPREFVRAAGLRAIRLPNAPIGDASLRPYQDRPIQTTTMDFPDGFEAYRRERRESGSKLMHQIDRRVRKGEREVGPMRFVWHTDDDDVFTRLLEWKAKQRRATGTPNVFDLPWARALVEHLRTVRTDDFEGLLSAVYFGDQLAAAHFGVRWGKIIHYWVPAYAEEMRQYSPGLACLMGVAREASVRGVVRIDLGVGGQRFKQRAGTRWQEVATATVSADPAVGAMLSTADGVRAWARRSRVSGVLHTTRRAVTRGSYLARSLLG
jgi:CelD/BcsL family acetyltransferase involved in cellulose biosynthesis